MIEVQSDERLYAHVFISVRLMLLSVSGMMVMRTAVAFGFIAVNILRVCVYFECCCASRANVYVYDQNVCCAHFAISIIGKW